MTPPNKLDWHGPSQLTALTSGVIHLWRATLDLPADCLCQRAALLSGDEIERANRLRSPAGRRFVAARSILRLILGRYLHCDPSAVSFTYGDRGKPFLNMPHLGQPLQFNLSHSQDLAVFAIAAKGAIGVDVEWIRPVPSLMRLARRYFLPQEVASLEAISGPQRLQQFFDLWTQKEAYIKATGEGIQGLAAAQRPAAWSLSRLSIEPSFTVAVTASSAVSTLHLYRWQDDWRQNDWRQDGHDPL